MPGWGSHMELGPADVGSQGLCCLGAWEAKDWAPCLCPCLYHCLWGDSLAVPTPAHPEWAPCRRGKGQPCRITHWG